MIYWSEQSVRKKARGVMVMTYTFLDALLMKRAIRNIRLLMMLMGVFLVKSISIMKHTVLQALVMSQILMVRQQARISRFKTMHILIVVMIRLLIDMLVLKVIKFQRLKVPDIERMEEILIPLFVLVTIQTVILKRLLVIIRSQSNF